MFILSFFSFSPYNCFYVLHHSYIITIFHFNSFVCTAGGGGVGVHSLIQLPQFSSERELRNTSLVCFFQPNNVRCTSHTLFLFHSSPVIFYIFHSESCLAPRHIVSFHFNYSQVGTYLVS